jgi:hypothetical protein
VKSDDKAMPDIAGDKITAIGFIVVSHFYIT